MKQRGHNTFIINQIISKFPSEYTPGDALGAASALALAAASALASNKRDAFWERYDADAAFKNRMKSSYAYKKQDYFDFLLIFDELREYLKPELQHAEMLLIEQDKASVVIVSDVRDALEIAKNVEEFRLVFSVRKEREANIWLKLERRLDETHNCLNRIEC